MVSLRVIGTAVFYLYRTRRTVGKIPFSTTVEIHLKTVSFDDGRANNNSVSGSGTKYREALGVKSIPHKKANKIEGKVNTNVL
jgi:hypothetical protein